MTHTKLQSRLLRLGRALDKKQAHLEPRAVYHMIVVKMMVDLASALPDIILEKVFEAIDETKD